MFVIAKIKKYLNENPPSHGVYICTCNKDNTENKNLYTEFIENGYHELKIKVEKSENAEDAEKGKTGGGDKREKNKCIYCGQLLEMMESQIASMIENLIIEYLKIKKT